ncbi:monooxygenase [Nocardia otitidiscaviarum]|uniref:Monooxygenase n=1 Tax=Nocardia otitidiscaviarum TaxID=1823 RepID=A0A516NPN5_9NOCA|nr:FAD-dependent monooxygenase [Nocardia otitidiscaviarum]MCP9623831.1 FAD-dependent monooxygenase [Nocardia otitidiscaviarum]QDP80872.1 monooxygenase [Nocardia otitidiscaviarum]
MSAKVLISGAGIAGSTLAYWLGRYGFAVTVVERAASARTSGSPVDVRGAAVDVVTEMGVLPELRAGATHVERVTFVDDTGRRRATVRTSAFGEREDEIEVARADLAGVLLAAAGDRAEIRWGDTITGLVQDVSGVRVTFAQAPPERFDYVVGADGLHSTVRRLVFGPERNFLRHRGIYIATLPVERLVGDDREVLVYNTPGRSVSVHPAGGRPLAAFMFRRGEIPGLDYRETAAHKRIIIGEFTHRTGIFADLLDQVRTGSDLYFDSVGQVRLPSWSNGRVALLGDAASCVSLFGNGSSSAIIGAHTLAEELARTPELPRAALSRYEYRHRAVTSGEQRGLRLAAALLVPGSRPAILLRDTAIRLLPSR